MSSTVFSIDEKNKELECSYCNSKLSLEKSKDLYKTCECFNIRLVYCKSQIHISLNKEQKDYWYEYKR